MTFLNPVPALIAAGLTIPALLFLYFLRLRRRTVRVSSTLLWTRATRDLQVNVPFRLLRSSWLLLLQLLILGLFLAALARPALDVAGPRPARVVVLIDRSASMSAADAGPRPGEGEPMTRLEAARERARRLTSDWLRAGGTGDPLAGGRTAVCIVAFAGEARALTGFTGDAGALREAIDRIEPSDQPGDIRAALRLAGALVRGGGDGGADESEASPPALVILLSDGSFPPGEGLALAGAEFRYEWLGPPPADPASSNDSEMPDLDNLGIVALAARRDHDNPAIVRLFARLQNAGPRPVTTPLVLRLDGREVERRALDLPGARAPGAPGSSVAPGTVATTFEFDQRGAAIASVSIERSDALPADDTAGVVLRAAVRPRMLLVTPEDPGATGVAGPEDPSARARWLLADLLQELRPRALRTATGSAFERMVRESSPIGAIDADLVVFDGVEPATLPACPSLSFGAGLPMPGLRLASSPGAAGTEVLSWRRTHPVLRDVALDAVFISRPLTTTLDAEAGAGARPPVTFTELVRGRDGPLITLVEQGPVRRIVVGFDLAHSNWPLQFGFPIFVAAAVDHLTMRGDDQAGSCFTTTQPASFERPPGDAGRALAGPDGRSIPLPEALAGEPVAVPLGVIERAGLYLLPGADPPAGIAVNLLDEHESAIRVERRIQVGGQAIDGSGGAGARAPREIWPWFVLAALALLAIEWFLNAWMMRV